MPLRSLLLSVCVVACCGASARAQDITTDLVAHWEFDETSGNVAADSSGNGNDGTAVNHAWVSSGKIGGCIELDGSFDYVAVTNSSSLQISGDITLAAWVNADAVSGEHCIVGHGSTSSPVQNTYLYAWYDDWLGGSNNGSDQYAQSSASTGSWTHVVAVHNGSQWRLFVNGVLVDTLTTSQGAVNVSGRWGIGAPSSYTSRFFDGLIDEVRIYSRALSDTDVAALHAYDGTSLVGHWKLDETSGTTAADSSDASNDGTYTNGVTLDQSSPHPGVTAPEFDGADDHVDIPSINADFSGGLTVAAWIKPDATLPAGQFHEVFEMSNGSQVDQVLLSYGGATGLQLFMTDTIDGSSIRTIEDNTGFEAGRWVHCVATVDSSGNAKLYRNGQVTKSGFFTSLPTNVTRNTVTIGKSSFGDHFGGGIQDVRVYNYELTAADVNELYGLVGHWDFDEGSGTTIAENTGVASDATFNTGAPTWIDGVRGKALEFDGTNDARTDEQVEPSERGAVAFWMRSDGTPGSRQRPWGVGADFEVWQDSDGLVSMDVSTDGFQGGFITTTPLDTAGRWYHVVAQYDSADNSYEIYLDGVLHKSGVSTWNITQQPADYLTFGTRTGNTQRFSGGLDDFRIYNRWLNATEIAEIYGLIGWWRMEEASGAIAADSSGAGNHGSIIGSGAWSIDAIEENGALELDGASRVETSGLLLESGGDATIAGWAKLTGVDTYGCDFISVGDALIIRLDDPLGTGGTRTTIYNGSSWQSLNTERFFEDSGWRHFATTFRNDTRELKLYIDGVLMGTRTIDGPLTLEGHGDSVVLGAHGDLGTTRDYFGLLDDVRVYNRAITPDEARALYYGEYTPGLRIVRWVEVANP